MEKIGYIKKDNINFNLGLNSIFDCNNCIEFGNRFLVEHRTDVVQFICAGVIMTKDNKILVVRKRVGETSKDSPERNKALLFVGGHLDSSDMDKTTMQTFKNGMKREVFEELGVIFKDEQIGNPVITYTPTSIKDSKHMGIMFPIIINKPFNAEFSDGKCKFVDIAELNKINNFEPWSEILLKRVLSYYNSKHM